MFRIFSVPVSGYMFFYMLGIAIGALLILRLARKEELDPVEVAAFILLGICCGWLGSRLLGSAIMQVARLGEQPFSFRVLAEDFKTGGSFFGAVSASLLYAFLYSRAFFKKEYRRLWDITAIGIALGHAVGRLGCMAAGCCFGIPSRLPWAVSFRYLGRAPHPCAGIPLHPVQLYEAALCFVNFIFLLIWRKNRRFPGEVFCLYLINYGLIRFALEFLRTHSPSEVAWPGGLSWYQIFSLALVLLGILARRGWQKKSALP
ncbi:MAG TPA: prolipoprotein diacylglyceryl transferase family protein [Candidatus Binatia bacterium]|nr:prolipoprotein diacylglyceryl transferase family protein [Candidatus Binatia bacterium]